MREKISKYSITVCGTKTEGYFRYISRKCKFFVNKKAAICSLQIAAFRAMWHVLDCGIDGGPNLSHKGGR